MTKIKDIIKNLKNVDKGTWIRLALLLLAVINKILEMCGVALIPISNEELTEWINTLFLIVVGFNVFWKNNSFTGAALAGDACMEEVRAEERGDL